MSNDSGKKHTLPTIRTFAADLERTRSKEHGDKDPEQHTNAQTKKETSKRRDEKQHTTAQARTNEREHDATSSGTESRETSANPPFHTIQDKKKKRVPAPLSRNNTKPLRIDTSEFEAKKVVEKPSVLESTRRKEVTMADFDDGSEGTIISDTKRKRFRFFPSLIESIRTSLIEFGEIFTGSKRRTYSVPNTDRRKGVIQTATSRTGRFATSDHSDVVKRLKERKQHTTPKTNKQSTDNIVKVIKSKKKVQEKQAKPIKKPEPMTIPSTPGVLRDPARLLEPADEPVAALAEPAPEQTKDEIQKITDVRVEPRKSVAAQRAVVPQLTPVVPHQPIPTPPPEPVTQPVPAAAAQPEPVSAPEPPPPAPDSFVQQPVVAAMSSGALNNYDTIAEEQAVHTEHEHELVADPEIEPEPVPEHATLPPRTESNLSETNLLAIGAVISILLVFTAFLAIRATFGLILDNNSVAEVYRPTIILEDSIIRTATLSEATTPALIEAVTRVSQGEITETTQINPVLHGRGSSIELTPKVTLELLNKTAEPSFVQAVQAIAFGVRVNGTPFIIMQISDTNTVRGGLLTWEPQMRTDLATLFDIPAVSSTTTNAITPFADTSVQDIDVRVLQDDQQERIVYGFVTPNLVIIAATVTDFSGIASLVQD